MQILIFIVFILKHNLSQGNRTFIFFKLSASDKGKRANSGGLRDWRGRPFKDQARGRQEGWEGVGSTHTHTGTFSLLQEEFSRSIGLHSELSVFLPNRAY